MVKKIQNNKSIVASYIKELKSELFCSPNMKKAIIAEIIDEIDDIECKTQFLTLQILYDKVGQPYEIARNIENRDDIEKLKQSAKKYHRTKIICAICLLIAFLATVITIFIVKSNKTYHSKTYNNSYIAEETYSS